MSGDHPPALVRETPFVGELLYSIRARELAQLALPSGAHLHAYQTAGRRRVHLAAPIPRDLSVISGYSARHPLGDSSRVLEQFTTLPYFTRFRPDRLEIVQAIGATGLAGTPTLAWTRLGLARYPTPAFPETARFCPRCTESDQQSRDVWIEYWHREHQLPGVEHCFRHRCALVSSCRNCGFGLRSSTRSLLMVGECLCDPERRCWGPGRDDTPMCTDAWARLGALSAECLENPETVVPDSLGACVRMLLAQQSFGSRQLLKFDRVAARILQRFDASMIARLFGVRDIEALLIRRLRRMAGPDAPRQPTIMWILLIGAIFESVGEFQAAISQIDPDRQPRAPAAALADWQAAKVDLHRATIRAYLEAHPEASREAVRLDLPGPHSYLRRRDRAWLRSNLPPRKVARPAPRGRGPNYGALDRAWSARLKKAFDEVWESEGRPVRATAVAAVEAAGIGKSRFWRVRNRLPLSTAVIGQRQESREAHQRRCLRWAIEQMQHRGTPLSTIALRHSARLPERVILRHGAFVVSEAQRLQMVWRMPNWCRLAASAPEEIDGKTAIAGKRARIP